MATLGTAAIEYRGTGLGLHASKKAMNLAATTTVWLKGTLGHDGFPVRVFSNYRSGARALKKLDRKAGKPHSAAAF